MTRLAVALALVACAASGCLSASGTRTRSLLVASSDPYADELVAAARRQGLAARRQWLRLGHYESTWTGSFRSEADGDNFFLSPRGRTDPDAELVATLRGFFATVRPYDEKDPEHRGVQHPRCQFPARWLYLSRELGIDAARLPAVACPRFDEFHDTLKARSVTFVFSSYYLNNPASAFGHTFLRLNKRDDDGVAEEKRQLLDFGIDYSAAVDTTFAPVYALKGLFGLFPGVFGKVPFYYKVREYNDFESRDLWEYELALDQAQTEMLVAHVWELGSTFFRYYYLTANCSYHIMRLLDVARPDLDLGEGLHTPVLPADTVKAVALTPGLVTSIRFRPSLRTQFRARVAGLSSRERDAVARLVADPTGKLDGFDDGQKIHVLDAAQDLVDLTYAREMVEPGRLGMGVELKQRLLARRAQMLLPSTELRLDPPWQSMPQRGHLSRRVALGGGVDQDGHGWLELGGRLAMHDLADPPVGYPELAELEFAPFRVRWDLDGKRLTLEQLDLVHIRSISGQDRYDHHISWEARLGSERRGDACDCYAFHVQLGGGAALATAGEGLAIYLLVQTHVWISGGLDGIRGSALGAGVGPSLGLRLRLARTLVALATGEWLWMPDQDPSSRLRVTADLRWELVRRRLAVNLGGQLENDVATGTLATLLYF